MPSSKPAKQVAAEILDFLRTGLAAGTKRTERLVGDATRHAQALEALLRRKSRGAQLALAGSLLLTVAIINLVLGFSLAAWLETVGGLALSLVGFARSR